MKRTQAITVVAFVVVGLSAIVAVPRVAHYLSAREAEQLLERELPPVVSLNSLSPSPSPDPNPRPEVNLPVPFTVQAPHANWEMPYKEACEETSALMAIRYVFGTTFLDAADADAAIRDLVRTNEEILKLPFDQTAEQIRALMLEIEPRLVVRLLHDSAVEQLKQELSGGNVIIVPAAGRKLGNPFYRRPGPLYHMLVLRGYTADGYFITNDPGTKRGEGYLYPFSRIMEAMGDWDPALQQPDTNRKVVLVVEPLVR